MTQAGLNQDCQKMLDYLTPNPAHTGATKALTNTYEEPKNTKDRAIRRSAREHSNPPLNSNQTALKENGCVQCGGELGVLSFCVCLQ